MQPYLHRVQAVQKHLQPHQAILISLASDLTYLTGFRPLTANEREGFLLISSKEAELFAAAFSPLPSYLEESTSTQLTVTRSTSLSKLAQKIAHFQISELFVDETGIYLSEAKQLEDQLTTFIIKPQASPRFLTFDRRWIWTQRVIKDAGEITAIQKAADIVKTALSETLRSFSAGQTEQEIAYQLEARFHQLGAEGPAFPTIVAFGAHATLPHHQPGSTHLQEETAILIDCGACVDGYNSDITRTVWFGQQPSKEYQKAKQTVDQAYQVGIETLRTSSPLPTAKDVDVAVRSFLTKAGYGDYYIHTTGHGIGLEVHEPPSLYQTNEQPLAEGMVITIEPGVYLPGKFGYRFENTVLITSQGPEELTQ